MSPTPPARPTVLRFAPPILQVVVAVGSPYVLQLCRTTLAVFSLRGSGAIRAPSSSTLLPTDEEVLYGIDGLLTMALVFVPLATSCDNNLSYMGGYRTRCAACLQLAGTALPSPTRETSSRERFVRRRRQAEGRYRYGRFKSILVLVPTGRGAQRNPVQQCVGRGPSCFIINCDVSSVA